MGSGKKGSGKLPTNKRPPGRPKGSVKPRKQPRPVTPHPEGFLPNLDKGYVNAPSGQSAISSLEPDITACHLTLLSDKHIYFCKRYVLTGGNAAKSARESGYSAWYGQTQLLKDPLIIAEIERYRASRADKFQVSTDRIIAELCKVAFSNLDDYVTLQQDGTPLIDCSETGREEMAALAEITQDTYTERIGSGQDAEFTPVKKTKIKLHSKVQALEQLSRIFKMYGVEGLDGKMTPQNMAQKIREALKHMESADGDSKEG